MIKKTGLGIIEDADASPEVKFLDIMMHLNSIYGSNVTKTGGCTFDVKSRDVDVHCAVMKPRGHNRVRLRISSGTDGLWATTLTRYKTTVFEVKESGKYRDGTSKIDIIEAKRIIDDVATKARANRDLIQKQELLKTLEQMKMLGKIQIALKHPHTIRKATSGFSVEVINEKSERKLIAQKSYTDINSYVFTMMYNRGYNQGSSFIVPFDKVDEFVKDVMKVIEYA